MLHPPNRNCCIQRFYFLINNGYITVELYIAMYLLYSVFLIMAIYIVLNHGVVFKLPALLLAFRTIATMQRALAEL